MKKTMIIPILFVSQMSWATQIICTSGGNPVTEIARISVADDGSGGKSVYGEAIGTFGGKKLYLTYVDNSQTILKSPAQFRIDAVATSATQASSVEVSATDGKIEYAERDLSGVYILGISCRAEK